MHRIRLDSPWEVVDSPDGCTRHSRKFGQPRMSDATEHIWLVCDAAPGGIEVYLNDQLIATQAEAGPFTFDITAQIQARNMVAFLVPLHRLLGEVALVIGVPEVQ